MSLLLNIQHSSGSLAGKSQRIALKEGQVLRLGRATGNDIQFSETQDDNVSSNHAELSLRGGQLLLEDKKSANGSFLNGTRVPPGEKLMVPSGSRLRLAPQGPEMSFSYDAPQAAPAKDSVGKATLLREIDKARGEERGRIEGELSRSQKKTSSRMLAGLLLVLLLAGLGIAGGFWWSGQEARATEARLSLEQRMALEKDKNTWPDVERRVNPAVVQVVCNYRLRSLSTVSAGAQVAGKEFTGGIKATGVLIRPGMILTALHAVEPWKYNLDWAQIMSEFKPEYDSLEVQFPGFQPLHATVGVTSEDYDLALLRVAETNAQPIEMGQRNDDVHVTQHVAVLGYPGELGQYELTMSDRNAPGKDLRTRRELNPTFVYGAVAQPLSGAAASRYLYFDGSLSAGNNGGPVVNERGQLIGIVTTKFERRGTLFRFQNRKIESRLPIEPSNFAVSPDDIETFLREHGLL